MDKIIKLLTKNNTLFLKVNKITNWCKVYHIDTIKGANTFLGADNYTIISLRLCSALKRENIDTKIMYKQGNTVWFWMLTLSEVHAAIYGSLTDNYGIKILCIEDGGRYLPELSLEKQDVEYWIATLQKEA